MVLTEHELWSREIAQAEARRRREAHAEEQAERDWQAAMAREADRLKIIADLFAGTEHLDRLAKWSIVFFRLFR